MDRLGLTDAGAKSRYSQSYLSSVCSQTGHTLQEGRQDEDCWAVDTTVNLQAASVYVQLKCTSSPAKTRSGFRVKLKQDWVDKWSVKCVPVYVLLVVVPQNHHDWIEHFNDATVHRTHAYWERFDATKHVRSILIPTSQRFVADTFTTWEAELNDVFVSGLR